MMTRTLGPTATKIADSLRSALGPRAAFEVRELDHGGQIRVNVRGLQTTFGYLVCVGNEKQEDRTEEFVTKIIEARACAFEERAAIIAESMQLSREDSAAQAACQMGLSDDEIELLQGARE